MSEELSPEQYHSLSRLLISAFEIDEMLDLVYRLPNGFDLAKGLPNEGKTTQFFTEMCRALKRRGMLDQQFFDLLVEERQGRFHEIRKIAALFSIEPVEFSRPAKTELRVTALGEVPAQQRTRVVSPLGELQSSELRPTLGEWLKEKSSAVVILCGVPIAAGVLAWSVAGTKEALFLGQGLFATIAAVRVWRWSQPSGDPLFGPSPTFECMASRIREAGPHATLLSSSTSGEPAGWPRRLTEAQTNRNLLRISWCALWVSWAALYSFAFVGLMLPENFTMRTMWEILLTGCNSAAAAAMFVCYCGLTWEPNRPRRKPDRDLRFGEATVIAVSSTLLFSVTHFFAVIGQFINFSEGQERFDACVSDCVRLQNDAVAAFSSAFELGSGIASAVIMSLLIGRLDSKYLDLDQSVLVALYSYAAIQPSWSMLSLLAPSGEVHPNIEVALFSVAWAAKTLLFLMWAWLFHTGRLDFYFLRISRLDERLCADWVALTAAGSHDVTVRRTPS